MTESNKIIQSFWLGKNLSKLEQLSISSYLMNGHEFHLYCYEDILGLPTGTIVKDANKIIENKYVFADPQGSLAPFADWFRYLLLFEKGGWWVDMDSVCLKYFDFPEDHCFSSEVDVRQRSKYLINNTYIKAVKGDDFLQDCIDYIKLRGINDLRWAEFGPQLLGKILSKYDIKDCVKTPEVFCPSSWFEISNLIAKPSEIIFVNEQTYAIHFWNEIWRRGHLDKNATYHPDSIFEQMKKKYEIA